MLIEMLNILENFDLRGMEHNSAEYLRIVSEAMKRATVDKDAHVGDPKFVKVPVERLTSKAYAKGMADDIARGVKAEEIVVMPYPQYGVKLYGNVVIVGEEFLKKNPEAVKRFLKAFSKGVKDVVADPKVAVATVKARDGIINEELELRRLKLCLDATVLTPDAKTEGFGNALAPRLSLMASQVSDAFGTKERINPTAVWNGTLLPSEADRNIFAVAKK